MANHLVKDRNDGNEGMLRTAALTASALVAFAANSLLGRLALGAAQIDPASYTSVRLLSGAVTLWAIVALSDRRNRTAHPRGWVSAAMLFLYAISFSFAYLSLDAGIGALFLFGAVQITMILVGISEGKHPSALEWLGLLMAFGGLIYLVSPGLSAPAPLGSLLMFIAGVAWGLYTLRGRGVGDPVVGTATNFALAVPLALLVSLVSMKGLDVTARGALLAVMSGAVASGMGYVIWYAALKGLTTTRAAVVQLSVPVLAAIGGVVFLGEAMTLRLCLASAAILGGIALAILGKDTNRGVSERRAIRR
jgi:drug/metabolite transporter (DMT)-like permease